MKSTHHSTTFESPRTKIPALAALGAAGLLAVFTTGCLSDSGSGPDGGNGAAAVQGRVQGDVETGGGASAASWEGAVVTAHEVGLDGTLGAAEDSATVSADGMYRVETAADGRHEWILRVRRDGDEWMARFEGDLEAGSVATVRPMNLESTLEAATYLELRKSEEGREVASSEVSVAIDADAAVSAHDAYRAGDSARAALIADLAAAIEAASRARQAFLAEVDAQYGSHRAAIDSARARAEVELAASLHAAASDTGEARLAERAYLRAFVDASLQADLERTGYARSAEASYHAMIRASVDLSDSVRTALARGYARMKATASDTAMHEAFRAAGASEARVQLVVDAGARYRAAVEAAGDIGRLDSAAASFDADLWAAFRDTSDTGFAVFQTVASNVAVVTLLDSLSVSLRDAIDAGLDGTAVGEAYAEGHVEARAELESRLGSVNDDDAQVAAVARLLAFVAVDSRP